MPPIIPNRDTPGIVPYIVGVFWLIAAMVTVLLWRISDGQPDFGLMLNSGIASVTASLEMARRFQKTGDFGWLRLSIPFAMIFFMTLFGYAHYLLTTVAQLATAFMYFLIYRDAQH